MGYQGENNMIDPISAKIAITVVKIATTALIIGLAWAYIRDFFTETIIPAIRKYVSETLANGVADVVGWVDAPATAVKKIAKETMASFKKHVLGIQTVYKRENAHFATEKTTTYLVGKDNTIQEITKERQRSMDDLPPDIRAEFIKHHDKPAQANMKEQFEEKVREKLELTI